MGRQPREKKPRKRALSGRRPGDPAEGTASAGRHRRASSDLQPSHEQPGARVARLEQQQRDLVLERDRLRALIDCLPEDVFFVDASGNVVLVNEAARSHLGIAEEDGLWRLDEGESIFEVFTPDGHRRRPEESPFHRALEGDAVHGEELLRNKKTGELRHRTYDVAPVLAGGKVVGAVSSVRDVTDVRRSEAEVREHREKYRSLIETTADFIWEMDSRGRYTYCSPQMKKLWGIEPEEMIGKTPFDVMPAEHRAAAAEAFAELARAARTFSGLESVSHDGRGGLIYLEISGVPFFDEHGGLLGYRGTTRDITERKRAEAEVRQANLRLADADRRKNQFLAVLSHELRNPLAPIKNSLYILDRAVPGGDQARRAKDVIERQIDQLSHIVDDLLDVTRITRGKIQLQRRRLELNELVRRTMDDHRAVFEIVGVRLELEAASQQVFVDGDWNRVAQVVSNLLQNSAKFTPRGGRVSVTVAREPETRQAVIRVADDGAGMTRELLDRLFQPFMQADETLDRSKGGLGLGLALVKGIVELHGGTIEASSQGPNLGSEFVVRLPLDLSAPAAVEQRPPRTEGAPHRVLIVEDNVDAAESLKELLELCGHEATVAHDGPEGLARAREVRPDVVLCDVGLPGMDGYEVARVFRADDALRQAYLVALTGYAMPEDLQRAAEAGFARHLAKPPSMEKLEELLAEVPVPVAGGAAS